MRSVRTQTTASTSPAAAHRSAAGQRLVAVALHDLVPGGDDGIEPALRQLAGHEDTGHAEGA